MVSTLYAVYRGKKQDGAYWKMEGTFMNCRHMYGGVKMANEKRLIDADALEKDMRAYADNKAYCGHIELANGILKAVGRIDDAPTVDAVEVVHARWEDEHGGKYANPRYRCSACKERALYKFERDLLDNWKEVQALTPHCPYCMAKLDGGTDNDI